MEDYDDYEDEYGDEPQDQEDDVYEVDEEEVEANEDGEEGLADEALALVSGGGMDGFDELNVPMDAAEGDEDDEEEEGDDDDDDAGGDDVSSSKLSVTLAESVSLGTLVSNTSFFNSCAFRMVETTTAMMMMTKKPKSTWETKTR